MASLPLQDPPSESCSVWHKPVELEKWRPSREGKTHISQVVKWDTGRICSTFLHRVLCISVSSLVTLKWKNGKKMLPRERQEMLVLYLFQVTKLSRSRIAAFSRQIHSCPLANGQKVSCVILKGSCCRKAILIKVNACRRHRLFIYVIPPCSFAGILVLLESIQAAWHWLLPTMLCLEIDWF